MSVSRFRLGPSLRLPVLHQALPLRAGLVLAVIALWVGPFPDVEGLSAQDATAPGFAPAIKAELLPAPAIHTPAEIAARLDALKVFQPGPTFASAPATKAPYAAGKLQAAFINHGLATLNFFRYLAGLGDAVVTDPAWTETAQYGAALLAIRNQGLDHTPAFPAGLGLPRDFYDKGYAGTSTSNLTQGVDNLGAAVQGFMDDSDSSNIDRLGHRRWLLFPRLDKVGFGMAGEYTALKVFDPKENAAGPDLAYVAWPGVGDQPLGWFGPSQAWSFSLNPKAFNGGFTFSKSATAVRLVRERDQKRWDFSRASSNGYFNIETTNFGLPFCLIFRPDRLGTLLDGDRFTVTIKGLEKPDGTAIPLSYSVRFFGTGPAIKPAVASKKPPTRTVYASSASAGMKPEAARTRNHQTTMGYVGPALTTFSWYVDSPDGILPIGIEINQDGVIHNPGEMITAPDGGIHHFRLVSTETGLKYTCFAQAKGWAAWVRAGETVGFDDGTPIETLSIILE